MELFIKVVTPVLLSTFCAALGWLYKNEREKRVFIERQLSDKKYDTYTRHKIKTIKSGR